MIFQYDNIRALDLFAGTGWGVSCRQLGIVEDGVDNMPEVLATREVNGLNTPWRDILAVPPRAAAAYDVLIASPPCQSFSIAGSGEGRAALDGVLDGVKALAHNEEPVRTSDDPRTWLVLEPLRFALAGQPPTIVWEQVPNVLPVWEACAEVLEDAGYYTWTGLLRTEQYGLPQTRMRAVLMAKRDEVVFAPRITHSRYYERLPGRYDHDLLPWNPMSAVLDMKAGRDGFRLALRSNYGTNGNAQNRGMRFYWQPAPTVTTKINRNQWVLVDEYAKGTFIPLNQRVSVLQAQQLQTYPDDFTFVGGSQNQYLQIGNAVPPRWGKALLTALLDL